MKAYNISTPSRKKCVRQITRKTYASMASTVVECRQQNQIRDEGYEFRCKRFALEGFSRSSEALQLGDSYAGAVAHGSNPHVLAFTVGPAPSRTKASTLFLGLTVIEVKASPHGPSTTSSVCYDVWEWYCQTGNNYS